MVRLTFDTGIGLNLIPAARPRDPVAVEPDGVTLDREELPQVVSFTEYGADARQHRPHVSTYVSAQVYDPPGRMCGVEFGDYVLQPRLEAHELGANFERALRNYHAGEDFALELMQVALWLVTSHIR